MKNIEKYTNTKDALDAFIEWYNDHKNSVLTMSGWLEKEYEAEPSPTLLEASEAVANIDEGTTEYEMRRLFRKLRLAIWREKHKPIRNCDKYKTKEEAYKCFKALCEGIQSCYDCRLRHFNCAIAWLYEEADKEVSE